MKAVVWRGKEDVRVEQVPEPALQNPRDIIVKVSLTAICGSDLHLYDDFIPTMHSGDILGHEFMGEVIAIGTEIRNLQLGDRVVVPFPIACGSCYFCQNKMHALCDNSNPNATMAEKLYGYSPAGIFGYSHMMGAYPGGQAEYVRVPYGDVGPFKVPDTLQDEQVLFLSDVLPTGYMAAENCQIKPGDTIAVWGAGPVGQFAVRSALLLGAERVIVIDRLPERLEMALNRTPHGRVMPLNFEEFDILTALRELTGGRGPDACIDAVGLEAHGKGLWAQYDNIKTALRLKRDQPAVLREMIQACRKGGTISIPGVYGGYMDHAPIRAIFNKGLQIRAGQTHVHRYMKTLLEHIEREEIDPTMIISHRVTLDEAPSAYAMFAAKEHNCTKVVMQPFF
jgi:threonine dehydrogenase-like Zn-dependent dehydrogenase